MGTESEERMQQKVRNRDRAENGGLDLGEGRKRCKSVVSLSAFPA